jgi:hypothetical protein
MMRVGDVFKIGHIDTTGIVCGRCGQPVTPKDIWRVRNNICGICAACHGDLFDIDLQQREGEEIPASSGSAAGATGK